MSTNKVNSHSSKTSSSQFTASRPSSVKSTKSKGWNPRRVLPSKTIPKNVSEKKKASSTGLIDSTKSLKHKKCANPHLNVKKDRKNRDDLLDHCKNCEDIVCAVNMDRTPENKSVQTSSSNTKSDAKSNKNGNPGKSNSVPRYTIANTNKKKEIDRKKKEPVREYYKNENYRYSESNEDITNGIKRISLDTIKEVSEMQPSNSLYRICPDDSEDDIAFLDCDDQDTLKQLKEFRQKNYFECHSAKSRIKNKGGVTSLQGHRCVYRFYLNDRLFPVPLNSDHNNQVRCVECHLPMELNVDDVTKVNGTIQAKVSIGQKNQDIMLLLPVKEPLIITEKRKEDDRKDKEVVFFGVINLDGFGNSMFNSTLPANSLALKYQKGYQEFENTNEYSYKDLEKTDVIVI